MTGTQKSWALHLGIIALLFVLQFVLPAYHHGSLARIMVLTCYAMGYNILFGYTGLLSLGHALFFAAGMLASSASSICWSAARRGGGSGRRFRHGACHRHAAAADASVAMIVTLMLRAAICRCLFRRMDAAMKASSSAGTAPHRQDLSDQASRYFAALILMAVCVIITLRIVQTRFGRVLVAIRENEGAPALGYDIQRLAGRDPAVRDDVGGGRRGLWPAVRLCRRDIRFGAIFDLPALVGAAWRGRQRTAVHRHAVHVPDRSVGELTTAYMLIAGLVLVALTLFTAGPGR